MFIFERIFRKVMNLTNKCVVITGGSQGLGKLLAKECVTRGAKVCLAARKYTTLQFTAMELRKYGSIAGRTTDIAKRDDVRELACLAIRKYGAIDVWINNAGVYSWESPGEIASEQDIQRVIMTNVIGTINASEIACEHMSTGHIMCIGSTSATRVMAKERVYGASKAALLHYTRNLGQACVDQEKDIAVSYIHLGRLRPEKPKDRLYLDPDSVAETLIDFIEEDLFPGFNELHIST
jgi:3-oxoacyl-[acyl-carrier protein] reductase